MDGAAAPPATIGAAWRDACRHIDRLDARLLVEYVSGCTHAQLIADPQRPLAADAAQRLQSLVLRRLAGEPLAYLVGSAGFHGLDFAVSPAVLIPRPDTELLVELALERAAMVSGALRIVDLGTGSGAIAVTLAHKLAQRQPAAAVTAVDRSPAALAVARANALRHAVAVDFVEGDWFSPLAGKRFELIVANPPYVAAGDPHLALNGLPFEPLMALSDGGDGLACLRAIVSDAAAHLADGGWLLLEHGYDQAAAVRALLDAAGFADVASWRDLGGKERVSGGRRP